VPQAKVYGWLLVAAVRALTEINLAVVYFKCHHHNRKACSMNTIKRVDLKIFFWIGLCAALFGLGRAGNRAPHCPRRPEPGAMRFSLRRIFRRGQRQLAGKRLSRWARDGYCLNGLRHHRNRLNPGYAVFSHIEKLPGTKARPLFFLDRQTTGAKTGPGMPLQVCAVRNRHAFACSKHVARSKACEHA